VKLREQAVILRSTPAIAQSSIPAGFVRIHYHRTNGDYAGWVIYDWTGAKDPSPSTKSRVIHKLVVTTSEFIGIWL
jgi:hypothetical protein